MNALAAPIAEPTVITAYEALKTDIAIAVQDAAGKVFNYRDPGQNRLARSYLFGLRGLRGSVESARVTAKASALERGRLVDSAAKELTKQLDDLIQPHDAALALIATEERDRIAKHTEAINRLVLAQSFYAGSDSKRVAEALEKAKAFDTSTLEEFKPEGDAKLLATIRALESELAAATGREAEAAELARLRAESAARAEADRIARVQAEAVESERARAKAADAKRVADEQAATVRAENEAKAATAKAAAAAKAKIDAAQKRELEAKLATEKANREKADAEKRLAESEARERAAFAAKMQEQADALARIQAREKAERENRAAVTATMRADLFAFIDNDEVLDAVVTALVAGQIRHLRMDWEA